MDSVALPLIAATIGRRRLAAGNFREDLFYRLSVVPIRVPALRERPHDIRLMAEYVLEEFCALKF